MATGGGESLVTPAGKVVDFWRLAQVVPVRLQNETTCTRDIPSTQQKLSTPKRTYTAQTTPQALVKKQFSDVQKDSFRMCVNHIKFAVSGRKNASKQASIHMHVSNSVSLVWGSLRPTPIIFY